MRGNSNNLGLRFSQIVDEHFDRVALLFEDGVAVTYHNLDLRSNQVARFILSKGAKRGDLVCLNLDKDVTPYCVIIACLKNKKIYKNF